MGAYISLWLIAFLMCYCQWRPNWLVKTPRFHGHVLNTVCYVVQAQLAKILWDAGKSCDLQRHVATLHRATCWLGSNNVKSWNHFDNIIKWGLSKQTSQKNLMIYTENCHLITFFFGKLQKAQDDDSFHGLSPKLGWSMKLASIKNGMSWTSSCLLEAFKAEILTIFIGPACPHQVIQVSFFLMCVHWWNHKNQSFQLGSRWQRHRFSNGPSSKLNLQPWSVSSGGKYVGFGRSHIRL